MSTPTVTPVVRIDVGKSRLDARVLPLGQRRAFANDKCGCRALRNWLRQLGVARAVFEPIERNHRRLRQCLFDSGLDTVPVNPAALTGEAVGHLAYNDRVDALMLAGIGLLDRHRGA